MPIAASSIPATESRTPPAALNGRIPRHKPGFDRSGVWALTDTQIVSRVTVPHEHVAEPLPLGHCCSATPSRSRFSTTQKMLNRDREGVALQDGRRRTKVPVGLRSAWLGGKRTRTQTNDRSAPQKGPSGLSGRFP